MKAVDKKCVQPRKRRMLLPYQDSTFIDSRGDMNRDNFQFEFAGFDGSLASYLRFQGERVLLFSVNVEPVGERRKKMYNGLDEEKYALCASNHVTPMGVVASDAFDDERMPGKKSTVIITIVDNSSGKIEQDVEYPATGPVSC